MTARDVRRIEALQSLLRKQQADLSEARLAFARADAERERAAERLRDAAARAEAVERRMREEVVREGGLALDALARLRAYLAVRHAEVERRSAAHVEAEAQSGASRTRVAECLRARGATERLRDRTRASLDHDRLRAAYDALDEQWILQWGRRG